MTDFIYDIETYPNVFTIAIASAEGGDIGVLECSPRKNQLKEILTTMGMIKTNGHRMVGFNNTGFDWPIIEGLLKDVSDEDMVGPGEKIAAFTYGMCSQIIEGRKNMTVWQPKIAQLDLQKIHHFDNPARRTSLKQLEFAMRMRKMKDLPYIPGTVLTHDEIAVLVEYNKHDITATRDFYYESLDKIEFREKLTLEHNFDFTNFNDTKIGKQLFIRNLEKELGHEACFIGKGWNKKPRQTLYEELPLKDVLFNYIKFNTIEMSAVYEWMMAQTLTSVFDKDSKAKRLVTKDVFTKVNMFDCQTNLGHMVKCNTRTELINATTNSIVYTYRNAGSKARIAKEIKAMETAGCEVEHRLISKIAPNITADVGGFEFVFGLGGIHGSLSNTKIESDEEYVIMDIDVASYYPSLAIENNLYPAHFGPEFCEIYKDIRTQRMSFAKGTVENAALKLALNGVYGDSNNKFSPFYDPAFTMGITLNGQLLLAMLAETLLSIPDLTMLQINTDGMTVKIKREDAIKMVSACKGWEEMTGLELEYQPYTRMWIRDVNNYIAEKPDGGLKLKGCYLQEREWHQNRSMMCVPKAAVDYLVHDKPIEDTVENNMDIFDFLMFIKTSGRQRLETWDETGEIRTMVQGRSRYYVSNMGEKLVRVDPPLAKTPDIERPVSINSGFKVNIANDLDLNEGEMFTLAEDIDLDFYVGEVEKITIFEEL